MPIAAEAIPVTVDNFIRAETDWALGNAIRDLDCFGKFRHMREFMPLDKQGVPRVNRDTLYSAAVFDLVASPVAVTLPDAGKRFRSMFVVNEDHYIVSVAYDSGTYAITKDKAGTRYVLVALRTLVDPSNPKDFEQAHALQDVVKTEQKDTGQFEVPNWDETSQRQIRDALKTLGATLPDLRHAFGAKGEVDPIRHLIATATAWGGNPDKDAVYLNVTPAKNDGKTTHLLKVGSVPVDAFWSITVYNAMGYLEANSLDRYNLNNLTAQKGADGSITVQFGGCDSKAPNCLPIMPGWNYIVRLYRPRPDIVNGSWHFPDAQPVEAIKAAA